MKKLLVIRFSSIGDIVLTSPIIRCIKQQMPEAEIHFLTKKKYQEVLIHNPHINKVFCIEKRIREVIPELRKENYNFIIDLHKNIRSRGVILKLFKPSSTFCKLNFRKWLFVRFKINMLPAIHIVDRYFKAVRKLNVHNDHKGLDYFHSASDQVDLSTLPSTHQKGYIAISVGSVHATKQLPTKKLITLCKKINKPIVLLGGKEDFERGEMIKHSVGDNIFNACGKYTINQSASLIEQTSHVITNDTGLMHIAAAYKKTIISVWGNTVPAFGMYPYLPKGMENKSRIIEINKLSCRPCSKLGFKECPKKHFNCMMLIQEDEIVRNLNP